MADFSSQQIADYISNLQSQGGSDIDIARAMSDFGVTPAQVAEATGLSQQDINAKAAAAIYQEQLGNVATNDNLANYLSQLNQGQSIAQVREAIDRTREGYNYDLQNFISAFRQNFGQNPTQEDVQYWMGREDINSSGLNSLIDSIRSNATGSLLTGLQNKPAGGYTELDLAALEADPYAGYYATENPYYFGALPSDAVNVSTTPTGQYIQYTNPVTGQPVVSYTAPSEFSDATVRDYIQNKLSGVDPNNTTALDNAYRSIYSDALNNGVSVQQLDRVMPFTRAVIEQYGTTNNLEKLASEFTSTPGNNVLQRANVENAINLALSSGALSEENAASMRAKLDPANKNHATSWDEIYSTLSGAQARAILNNMGIQIGEDADPVKALAESSARNDLVIGASQGLTPGINPSNSLIAQYAQTQGIAYPFTDQALGLGRINTKATTANVYNNIGTELGILPDRRIVSGAGNVFGPTSGQFNLPQQLGSYTRPTFDIDANYNPYAMPTEQTTQYANPYQAGLDTLTGYGGQIAYPFAPPAPISDQTVSGYTRATLPDVGTPFDLARSSTAKADAEAAAPATTGDSGGARAGGLMSAYKKRMGKR